MSSRLCPLGGSPIPSGSTHFALLVPGTGAVSDFLACSASTVGVVYLSYGSRCHGPPPLGYSKHAALKAHGALNLYPEAVSYLLFQESEFFDPRDRAQVKYEMLRRVKEEGQAVSRAAEDFWVVCLGRPTTRRRGLSIDWACRSSPKKRGPRGGHKLTEEVMDFVAMRQEEDPSLA